MKAAQMTREDEIRSISQKYEMDKEKVRDILERGVRYADADKAALFACMTGKDIEEVLALRRETGMMKNISATVPAGCIVSMAWKKPARLTP